jgi:hypothetical protein
MPESRKNAARARFSASPVKAGHDTGFTTNNKSPTLTCCPLVLLIRVTS